MYSLASCISSHESSPEAHTSLWLQPLCTAYPCRADNLPYLWTQLSALTKWVTDVGCHGTLASLAHKLIIDVRMDKGPGASSAALALQ